MLGGKTLILFVFLMGVATTRGDCFVSSVSEKLTDGADFIKEKAGPAIRENFDSAKGKLQDPETHQEIQSWIKEKAVPAISEKWEDFKGFVNEEVVPEVQKVYEAASEANEREKQKKSSEN